jgi:Na+/melibiose symporter-like transporter
LALLYAAGDVGPSLTSLCIAFYFLIEVAGIPVVEAGAIHASGYVVSAFANIWAGHYLDRQQQSAARRAVFVAGLGVTMSLCFVLLWLVAFSGAGRAVLSRLAPFATRRAA